MNTVMSSAHSTPLEIIKEILSDRRLSDNDMQHKEDLLTRVFHFECLWTSTYDLPPIHQHTFKTCLSYLISRSILSQLYSKVVICTDADAKLFYKVASRYPVICTVINQLEFLLRINSQSLAGNSEVLSDPRGSPAQANCAEDLGSGVR